MQYIAFDPHRCIAYANQMRYTAFCCTSLTLFKIEVIILHLALQVQRSHIISNRDELHKTLSFIFWTKLYPENWACK